VDFISNILFKVVKKGDRVLNFERQRPLKGVLKGMSVLLAVAAFVLFQIFLSEYGLYEKLDWSYLSAAFLNLSVSLLLKINL
jgi:hypothetical protein